MENGFVCEDENCLMKCRFCGKITKPPGRCNGCGWESFDVVENGKLERYLFKHVGKEDLIVSKHYGRWWIVERINLNGYPYVRNASISYRSQERASPETLERAIDLIQIMHLIHPELIGEIHELYKLSDKGSHVLRSYTVSYPVKEVIRQIAGELNIPMTDLLTAFVRYVMQGGD